jgi:hypothetical protein
MAEAPQATPEELLYSSIPAMASPSATMTQVTLLPSTGTTYGGNGQCRIPINCPTDSFVDLKRAFIKFTVFNKSTGSADASGYDRNLYLDPQAGIASVIDRFQFISGTGSTLSETNHYNAYCALLNTHMMPDYVSTTMNITEGCSNAPKQTQSIGGLGVTDTVALTNREYIAGDPASASAGNGSTSTFVHRPKDPVFNANRLLPIGFLQGIPYINITFSSAVGAFRMSKSATANIPNWEIRDVELHVPVIQMDSAFNQSFRGLMASGIPISIATTGVVNSQQNLASGSSNATSTFACRKRNVRGLLTIAREQRNLEDQYADTPSCRRSLATTEYQYAIGGIRMPSAPLKVSETDQGGLLMETKKALGHLSSLHGLCADKSNYYESTNEKTATICQKSLFALDTQPYRDSDLMSGMNLSAQGLPIVWHGTLNSTNGAQNSQNILLDLFAIHDQMLTCDGISGVISSSS